MDSPNQRNDERKTIRVTIYNQPYTLAVSGESGQVEALAHSVDQLMSDWPAGAQPAGAQVQQAFQQHAGNLREALLQLSDVHASRQQDAQDLQGGEPNLNRFSTNQSLPPDVEST